MKLCIIFRLVAHDKRLHGMLSLCMHEIEKKVNDENIPSVYLTTLYILLYNRIIINKRNFCYLNIKYYNKNVIKLHASLSFERNRVENKSSTLKLKYHRS